MTGPAEKRLFRVRTCTQARDDHPQCIAGQVITVTVWLMEASEEVALRSAKEFLSSRPYEALSEIEIAPDYNHEPPEEFGRSPDSWRGQQDNDPQRMQFLKGYWQSKQAALNGEIGVFEMIRVRSE